MMFRYTLYFILAVITSTSNAMVKLGVRLRRRVQCGLALRHYTYHVYRILTSQRMLATLATLLVFVVFVLFAFERNNEVYLTRTPHDLDLTASHKQSTRKLPPVPPIDRATLQGYGRNRDNCTIYFTAARMTRELYVDVLNKSNIDDDDDITLVTQLTSSRSEKLYSLVLRWPGPISVTVYVEHSITIASLKEEMKTKLSKRNNIALHLVGEAGPFFPVNFLRNIALEHAKTKYIFLNDVDFEPMPQLESHLKRYISEGYLQGQTALVVPAFQAVFRNVTIPDNKADLLRLWRTEKTIKPFFFKLDKYGMEEPSPPHHPTAYSQWRTATRPYYANWADYYEPYVVTERKLTPKYWEGFVGRFYNKASHLSELFAMGFSFVVLPDVFVVHTPHDPANFTTLEFRCSRREMVRFRLNMMDKYGWEFPLQPKYEVTQ